MPEFYEKMKNRLRTAEQGADTASWLVNTNCFYTYNTTDYQNDRKQIFYQAISEAALKHPSGLFFEGKFIHASHIQV